MSIAAAEPALDGRSFGLTPSAAKRIAALQKLEGNDALMLRISVSGGGCSGFQYGFSLDESINADDHTFEQNGIRVIVDDTSLDLLDGAEVTFIEDLMGAYFQIQNPNATSSCGCGSSFAIG